MNAKKNHRVENIKTQSFTGKQTCSSELNMRSALKSNVQRISISM